MTVDSSSQVAAAREFVAGIDLRGLPHYAPRFLTEPPPSFQPDVNQDQSAIVGGSIAAFAKGVPAARRNAINDSMLLAQLQATQQVPDKTDISAWYDVYFNVLTNVGWILEDNGFTKYTASSDEVDVDQAILTLAASLLGGPAATGYQVIKMTLDALKGLADKSPWITLFSRESQVAHVARFQVMTADKQGDDNLLSLLAFDLSALNSVDQVLFFKFKSNEATLRQRSGKVRINDVVLDAASADIAAQVAAFTHGYVKGLPPLKPPAPDAAA